MKYDERLGPSADGGRAPSWEKRKYNTYFMILIIALLLSVVCLYFWNKDRTEAKRQFVETVSARTETGLPPIAQDLTSAFQLYGKKWQSFVGEIERADSRSENRNVLSGLPAALFSDKDMSGAWILLERDEASGKPAFAINNLRDYSESGETYAQREMQSEYYVDARKNNALRITPIIRREINMSAMFSSGYDFDSVINERMFLLVDGPVMRDGDFAGIAGFEVELPGIRAMFNTFTYSPVIELFLIDPKGEAVLAPNWTRAGEHYRNIPQKEGYIDALEACAEGAAKGIKYDASLIGSGSSLTFAAFAPIDAGDGGPTWFLAALTDMQFASDAGKGYLMALFLIWLTVICFALAIHIVRKRSTEKIKTEQDVAAMQPEAAAFFQKYERHRKACYVLCAFFFIPAMFALTIYEKRYRAALNVPDTKAAAKALSAMKMVAAVAVVIGCIILYLRIKYD